MASVPTPDEKRGDFSSTIINQIGGQPVFARIFDMFDGSTDAQGNFVSPEYRGAVIPQKQQAALWPFYASLWPDPNHAPDANTSSTNNYHAVVSLSGPQIGRHSASITISMSGIVSMREPLTIAPTASIPRLSSTPRGSEVTTTTGSSA